MHFFYYPWYEEGTYFAHLYLPPGPTAQTAPPPPPKKREKQDSQGGRTQEKNEAKFYFAT